jgi:hypothetical protein
VIVCLIVGVSAGFQLLWLSNVKHQRARATASRANGTISVRALRCMR